MEIGKAFSYPLQDKRKVFQTGIIVIIPLFGFIALVGYLVNVIRRVAVGDDEELPDWGDFGGYVKMGFVCVIAGIVYLLPALLLAATGSSGSNTGTILGVLLAFPLGFLFMVGLLRYAAEERLESFIEIRKNAEILLQHVGKLVGTYAVVYALNMAAFFVSFALAAGIVTICFSFFVFAYVYIVNAYLMGRLARRLGLELPEDEIFLKIPRTQPQQAPAQIAPTEQPVSVATPNPQPSQQTSQVAPAPTTSAAFVDTLDNAAVYSIQVPKAAKFEPEKAESLIKQILMQLQDVTFTIVADHKNITWQIWDIRQGYNPSHIRQAVKSIYPQAEVTVSAFVYPEFTNPFWRRVCVYEQLALFVAPIKYVTELTKLDPLAHFVQGMSELEEGERIIHMIHVPSMISEKATKDAYNKITRSGWRPNLDIGSYESAVGSLIGSTFSAVFAGREGKYEPGHQKIYEERLHNHFLMNCYMMTQVDVISEDRMTRAEGLMTTVLDFHGENAIVPTDKLTADPTYVQNTKADKETSALALLGSWMEGIDLRYKKANAILSTFEIASLWHLPNDRFTTPEIAWQSAAIPAKEIIENPEGIVIGDSTISGQKYAIRIHPSDRTTHMNIVGKTGVGKSTFMHNLIHQDIAAGSGVAVVDPHGKLVRDLLRVSIPDERIDDVVVLDIANFDYPPPLNPLSAPGDDETYTASEVIAILEKLESGGLPIRVADTMTAAFVTLRHEKNPTVRDVVRLFDDPEYRYRFINQVEDVTVQEFWQRFESFSSSRQDELSYPVIHRMRKFYGNPILHPILCHPKPLDFGELLAKNKIILLSLGVDARKVPETLQQVIGAVVVSLVRMAAASSYEHDTPFYLYIDEAQNFVTAPLDKIFQEARKFGLHLTIANQYLGQLEGKVLESMMGTVGATVIFQIGQKDARTLAPYFALQFEPGDLEGMSKFQAAVKTRHLGQTMPAFSIATRPEPADLEAEAAIQREAFVRRHSIERYTPMNKSEVLDWLNKRYASKTFTSPMTKGDGHQDVDWTVTE